MSSHNNVDNNNPKKGSSHAHALDLTQEDDNDKGDTNNNEVIDLLSDSDDDDVVVERVVPSRNLPVPREEERTRDESGDDVLSNPQAKRTTQGDPTNHRTESNTSEAKKPSPSLARSLNNNHHQVRDPATTSTALAVQTPLDSRPEQNNTERGDNNNNTKKKNPFPFGRTQQLVIKSTALQQRQNNKAPSTHTNNENNRSVAHFHRRSPPPSEPPPYTRVSAEVDLHKKSRGSRYVDHVGNKLRPIPPQQSGSRWEREDTRKNGNNSKSPHCTRPASENISNHHTSQGGRVFQKPRPSPKESYHRRSTSHASTQNQRRYNNSSPVRRQMGGTVSTERPLGSPAVHGALRARQGSQTAGTNNESSYTRNPPHPRSARAPHSRTNPLQVTANERDGAPRQRVSPTSRPREYHSPARLRSVASPKSSEESSEESTAHGRPCKQEQQLRQQLVIEILDSSSSSSSSSDEADDMNSIDSDLLVSSATPLASVPAQNSLAGTKRKLSEGTDDGNDGDDEDDDHCGESNEISILKAAFFGPGSESGREKAGQNSPRRDEIRRRRIGATASLRVNPKGGRSARALASGSPQLESMPRSPPPSRKKKAPTAPLSSVRDTRPTGVTNEKRSAGLKGPTLRVEQVSQITETSKTSVVEKSLVASSPKGGESLDREQTIPPQARQVQPGTKSFQTVVRVEGSGSLSNERRGENCSFKNSQVPAEKARVIQTPEARLLPNRRGASDMYTDSVFKPCEHLSKKENPQAPAGKSRAVESLVEHDKEKIPRVEPLRFPCEVSIRELATSEADLLPNLTDSPAVGVDSASESGENFSDREHGQSLADETDAVESFEVPEHATKEASLLVDSSLQLASEQSAQGPATSEEEPLSNPTTDSSVVSTGFALEETNLLTKESLPRNIGLTEWRIGRTAAEDNAQRGEGELCEKNQSVNQISSKKAQLSTRYDSIFQIQPKRESFRVKVRDLGVGDEIDYTQITTVEHLTKDYFDERGLPVREMVVHGGYDSILYRIRLHVEDTKFGYGAFLTYLGALRLERSEQARGDRMMAKREIHFPATTRLLDVIDVDGWEKTLRITGENLHGNNNNCYWPRHMVPVKAVSKTQDHIHTFFVKPTGRSCYVDDEDEEDANYVEAKLSEMKRKGLEPIGHLGIYCIEDYSPDQNVSFELPGNVIDIGRYGPFRKQDRKPLSAFDMKCFLFQNQPNRYPIEAKENLEGEAQMIDITDDVTGLPHKIARAHIPMYVNEVGHDLANKQTVFCTSSHNGMNANYHVALYDGLSLSNGSKVELLSNYHQDFEPTRELEGYGLKNLYFGLPDGKDLARRIQNGISERTYMLETIRETGIIKEQDVPESYRGLGFSASEIGEKMNRLTPLQFCNSIERIETFIHKPVSCKIKDFLATGDISLVSALQIVSNRRIGWLGGYYRKILTELKAELARADEEGRVNALVAYLRALSYDQAGGILSNWNTEKWLLTDGRNDSRIPGSGDESIQQILRNETQEDVCFELKEQIVQAFDRSLWCPVACDLIEKLIDAVHFSDFQPWASANEINESSGSRLEKDMLKALKDASNRVVGAILTGSSEELYFSSGLTEDHLVRGSISDIQEVCGSSDSLYLDNRTTPKCFTAEIIRRFTEIGALGPSRTNTGNKNPGRPLRHTDQFVMVRTSKVSGMSTSLAQIASTPQVATKAVSNINARWYLLWQVAFPALSFAVRYIPRLKESVIAHVCNEMNLERDWVDFALEKGIQKTPGELLSDVCVPKKEIIFDKVSALVFHRNHETYFEGRKRKRKDALDMARSRKVRRSQIDEKLVGHRPVGSGRMSITDEQKLQSQDLRKVDKRRKKKSGTTTTANGRPQAHLVWAGEPDEQYYPFNKEPINWPPGWKKQVFQRASGDTRGATDRYWFTPDQGYKLRSLKEVYNFFACMERNENDETRAWKAFKNRTG
eukprot:scaffold1353_cov161-Amphora_coffeaeformis.AAC.18